MRDQGCTCGLALAKKGADYDLVEVDILSGANKTREHLARHPFGKVQTPEGQKMLAEAPNLQRWWDTVRTRQSVEKTKPAHG